MLRPEDERAIEDLFERLRNVERRSGPRDADAEQLIHQRLREHPAAAYYMAQAIVVQEAALREQQQRIAELEAEAGRGRGGFLGGIFGDDRPASGRGPWDRQREEPRPSRGGEGFLAGAAQTALGVSGGLLLGSAIAGMFGGAAQAQEPAASEPAPVEPDPGVQDGGDEGFGGDWGGDFDIGGDF